MPLLVLHLAYNLCYREADDAFDVTCYELVRRIMLNAFGPCLGCEGSPLEGSRARKPDMRDTRRQGY